MKKPHGGLLLISLCCFLTGCVSTYRPGGKTGQLQGMLYDCDNSPVPGYCVQIDSDSKTFTDINGRFSFPDVSWGTHAISGSGENHIPFAQEYEFSDKTAIFHAVIPSHDAIYVKTDSALARRDAREAERLLEQLPEKERATEAWRLYSAIARYIDAGPVEGDCWLEQAERLSAYFKGPAK